MGAPRAPPKDNVSKLRAQGCSPDFATPPSCSTAPWYWPRPISCVSCTDFDVFAAAYDPNHRLGREPTPLEQFERMPLPVRFTAAVAVVVTVYNARMSTSHRRRYGPNPESLGPPRPFSLANASEGFAPRLLFATALMPGLLALAAQVYPTAPPRRFPELLHPEDREMPPTILEKPHSERGLDADGFLTSRYGRTRGWDFLNSSAQHQHMLFYFTVVMTYVVGEALGTTTIAEEDSTEISSALGVFLAGTTAYAAYLHLGPLASVWASDLIAIGVLALFLVIASYAVWTLAQWLGLRRVAVPPPPGAENAPDGTLLPPRYRWVRRPAVTQLALVGFGVLAAVVSLLVLLVVETREGSSYIEVQPEKGKTREVFGAEGRQSAIDRDLWAARQDMELTQTCFTGPRVGRKVQISRSPLITGDVKTQTSLLCSMRY